MDGGADGYALVRFIFLLQLFVFYFPPAQLDVAIDGADEVDADLALIKGGG